MFILLAYMLIQDMDVCVAASMFPDPKAETILRAAGERSLPYLRQKYRNFALDEFDQDRYLRGLTTNDENILGKKLTDIISDVCAVKVKRCIDGLSNNNFFVRERCHQELLITGPDAMYLLKKVKSKDPEVIWRVDCLIRDITVKFKLPEEIPAPSEAMPKELKRKIVIPKKKTKARGVR